MMKPESLIKNAALAALLLAPLAGLHAAEVAHLSCEYRDNPLGLDVAKPRLSWVIESARRGERQTTMHKP